MIDQATIDEASRRLRSAVPSRSRVILFGSNARGEAGEYSELEDLAAVEAMMPVETVTDVIVAFLAQQTVEKSLNTAEIGPKR